MKTNIQGWGGWLLLALVVAYVAFLIVAPLAALVQGAFQNGLREAGQSLTARPFIQALWLSVRIAVAVVAVQAIFGTLTAWVLTRQSFFGKALLNGLLDIPFTLSPVVVGYMLLLLFGRNGFLGPLLESLNLQVAFAVPGMFLATLFVSLPFMVREMASVIARLDLSQEKAAETLGASRWRIFWQVIFPQLKTALIYGMTLTFARALGEFGAVLVIGGGVQGRTETATLYIFRSLDERQYTDAYVAAILLGAFSVLLVLIADTLKRRRIAD